MYGCIIQMKKEICNMCSEQIMIKARHLTKSFKIKDKEERNIFRRNNKIIHAVDDVSFQIKKGDLVGFIGTNGAGKSTTIKMLTGILVPDDGHIEINDMTYAKYRKDILMKIGVVFGQRSVLCWDIPVMESFRLFKDMYRIPTDTYNENIQTFSEILDLQDFMYQPPRLLSLGQRMRADLAAALLYNPEVLFLDEPTIGIDILAKERIRDFIRHINGEKHTTIILTTHDISDLEALCQKMIVINHGRIIFDGTLDKLITDYSTQYTNKNGEELPLETIIKNILSREEGD